MGYHHHQKIRRVERIHKVPKEFWCILIILLSMIVSNLWTVLPESEVTKNHFIFVDVQITDRTHYYFIFGFIKNLMWISAMSILFTTYRKEIGIIFLLYALDMVDYKLFYCDSMFYLKNTPVEWSLIKGIFVSLVCAKCLFNLIKNPPN